MYHSQPRNHAPGLHKIKPVVGEIRATGGQSILGLAHVQQILRHLDSITCCFSSLFVNMLEGLMDGVQFIGDDAPRSPNDLSRSSPGSFVTTPVARDPDRHNHDNHRVSVKMQAAGGVSSERVAQASPSRFIFLFRGRSALGQCLLVFHARVEAGLIGVQSSRWLGHGLSLRYRCRCKNRFPQRRHEFLAIWIAVFRLLAQCPFEGRSLFWLKEREIGALLDVCQHHLK